MNINGIQFGNETWDPPAAAGGGTSHGSGAVSEDLQRLLHPRDVGDFLHGLIALPGAVAEALGGVAGGALTLGAHWVEEQFGPSPAAEQLGSSGARIGALTGRLGGAAEELADAVEGLTHGQAQAFVTHAGHAIVEGLADLRQLRAQLATAGRDIEELWG